jgi:hypothetical protein
MSRETAPFSMVSGATSSYVGDPEIRPWRVATYPRRRSTRPESPKLFRAHLTRDSSTYEQLVARAAPTRNSRAV